MTCAHEPEETVGPVSARHCRHCGAEIEPIPCEECAGEGFVDRHPQFDRHPCSACDTTGEQGWRRA